VGGEQLVGAEVAGGGPGERAVAVMAAECADKPGAGLVGRRFRREPRRSGPAGHSHRAQFGELGLVQALVRVHRTSPPARSPIRAAAAGEIVLPADE
jgi:hypothetical protein